MTNKPNDFNFDEDPFGDENPFNGNGQGKSSGEFSFDDDFGSEPQFDFDEDNVIPPSLGDDTEADMPDIRTESEGGVSRTFIVIAAVMILLFIGALVLVVVLALRPTGPTDIELTATQIVLLNQTVEAQIAQTQTQGAVFDALTATAAAFTDTPSPSPTSLPPTEPPTRTPTVTLDPTDLAGTAQALAFAQTATALAQPTGAPVTPIPTITPTSGAGLGEYFATQVAFATQQGAAQQAFIGTQVALAGAALQAQQALDQVIASTQVALPTLPADQQQAISAVLAETQAAQQTSIAATQQAAQQGIDATQAAVDAGAGAADNAIANVDLGLAAFAATVEPIGTQIAQLTPEAQATQGALAQLEQAATAAAQSTQDGLATRAAESAPPAGTEALLPPPDLATAQAQATAAVLTEPQALATAQGQATQVALATRAALVQQALSGTLVVVAPTTPPLSGISLTATAIAQAFEAATALAPDQTLAPNLTPTAGFPTLIPTISTLPDTGVFDELSSGGASVPLLAAMVFGLVSVVMVARILRMRGRADDETNDADDSTRG